MVKNQSNINEILMQFSFKKIDEETARKLLSEQDVPNNVIDFMIRSPLYFVSVEEAVSEQPDLFDTNYSTFYDDNGLELVNIQPNKEGSKDYIFDTESSDYVDSLLTDPSDTFTIVKIMANAYTNSDDFAKILEKANRADNIIFNTSKNGKIKISVSDVFDYINYLKREERFNNQD